MCFLGLASLVLLHLVDLGDKQKDIMLDCKCRLAWLVKLRAHRYQEYHSDRHLGSTCLFKVKQEAPIKRPLSTSFVRG